MTLATPARRALVAVLAAVALSSTVAVVPAVAATPGVSASSAAPGPFGDTARLGYQKSVVVRLLKGVFEDGDTKVVDRYVRPDYIQHNPSAPDGAEALKGLAGAAAQQFPDLKYNIKRVISQGDLVLVHSNAVLTPGSRGSALVDIFRFQGGRIAEHWDVSQDVPDSSANGNDMFSTVTSPRTDRPGPAWRTAYNQKLVTKAFDQLFGQKDISAFDTYWGPEYQQHNPTFPNGVDAVKAGMGAYFQQFPDMSVSRKRVIAEGDLVAVHSHSVRTPGERGQAILDLFRVRNGKIVEHWDVIQDVPETSANDNTMF